MPFSENEVPERLKDKGIPAHFIRLFVQVWNSVYNDTHDEGRAYRAAYSQMGQALRKDGYYKNADGTWHKGSSEEVTMDTMLYEGWLPEGTAQNDLDDGDFAWLSQEYQKAEERKGMNQREHRKLPFKVHGKVDREGWKAAWKAAAHPGARHPDMSGGPNQTEVLEALRSAKPKGITINKDNTFSDSSTEEAHNEETFISSSTRPVEIIEEVQGGGLRYKGVALVDEALSANDRYYSARFNDKAMEATNAFMATGGTVTIYSRHGKAIAEPGKLPTSLPVGKVAEPLARQGAEIWYVGYISPTLEGKDCIQLIRDKVMTATSIRSHQYKSRQRKMNGRMVEEMLEGVIHGIDLTDEAGIHGAGIREVLETAQFDKEEDAMEWKDLTLEGLQANRQDLLDAFAADAIEATKAQLAEEAKTAIAAKDEAITAKTAAEAQLADIAKNVSDAEQAAKTITEERDAAKTTVAAKETEIVALKLKVAIAEAAHIGTIPKAVYASLVEEVKVEDDIARLLPGARSKAMIAHLSGDVGVGNARGQTHFDEAVTEEAGVPAEISADADHILALCI